MFARCELWQDHVEAGCYPDCDMLPLGMLGGEFGKGEWKTRFTREEQRTMLTPDCRPRQLCRDEEKAVWTAENAKQGTRYIALFNLSDAVAPVSAPVEANKGMELWTGEAAGIQNGELTAELQPHACAVYRLD